MPANRVRRDVIMTEDGFKNAAWGVHCTGMQSADTDGLWLLYSLTPRQDLPVPVKYAPFVTHEIVGYELSAGQRVDLTRNVWSQSTLAPILPPKAAFQFKAATDEDAIGVVQDIMDEATAGRFALSAPEEWAARLPDFVDMSSQDIRFDRSEPLMEEDDEAGVAPSTVARASIITWENARRARNALAWVGGFAAIAVVLAGSAMPALDLAESLGLPVPATATVTRTLEFEGGRKMVVKLTRKFGARDEYTAEVVNVRSPEQQAKFQDVSY